MYVANNGSNNVSIINGTTLAVTGTVDVGNEPLGVAVDTSADFGNVYVADYGSDQISIISGAGPSVLGTISVGIEPYGVAFDSSNENVYVTNQGSSNVSVISTDGEVVIATITVWGVGPLQGIALDWGDGYLWVGAGFDTVVLNPNNESVAAFEEFDPSGITYDPNNGDVCVTNTGNATFECIVFDDAPVTLPPDTFSETGLPAGTAWSVQTEYGDFTDDRNHEQDRCLYRL